MRKVVAIIIAAVIAVVTSFGIGSWIVHEESKEDMETVVITDMFERLFAMANEGDIEAMRVLIHQSGIGKIVLPPEKLKEYGLKIGELNEEKEELGVDVPLIEQESGTSSQKEEK